MIHTKLCLRIVFVLSIISSHTYCYIYTVYNTTGKDLWIETNISGQWQKQFMTNGQSFNFGFSNGWKKGLCLTELKYKHEQAASDKKNNKDWKLVQFSLGKDLKPAVVGGTVAAGVTGGVVSGAIDLAIGLKTAELTAGAVAWQTIIGTAMGAALGIAIVGGSLALSALCRNITGDAGIFVYENNKGKICWTFGKMSKK